MNLEQLIVFDRIVREGSFSKAAWGLQLAQPTVSARLKALEKSVGGELFKRNNRAVTLTERGSRFLPFARQALEAMQKGAEAAAQLAEAKQGTLRAGVLRSLTGHLISPALQQLITQHPTINCKMQEGTHWQLVEWLHDNQLEVAVVAWPSITPDLAEMTPILRFREPMVLLAHKKHPLAQMKTVTVADVERLSNPFFLLTWWQVTPEQVTRIADRASQTMEVPTDTGRYLISNGIGAGFFNRAQVIPELIHEDVVEIKVGDMAPMFRQSALVRLSRRSTLSAPATHFADCLAAQGRKLEFLID